MIVAGFGYRHGVQLTDLEQALDRASRQLAGAAPACIAVPWRKGDEAALQCLARSRGVRLLLIGQDDLEAASPRTMTHSTRALEALNVPSVAEAAALAGAGRHARLLGPRIVHGPVTCALAEGEGAA